METMFAFAGKQPVGLGRYKALLLALVLLPALTFSGSARGSDLTVWFTPFADGVRVDIGSWHLPEEVTLITPVVISGVQAYQVSTDVDGGGVFIRDSVPDLDWLGVFLSGPSGGTIDYSGLHTVDIPAVSLAGHGGVKLWYNGGTVADVAVIGFTRYDEEARVATFDVELWLPDVSLDDLFVQSAFVDGVFTVWQSDAFAVHFAIVPEPASLLLILPCVLTALLCLRRRFALRA